MIKPGPPAPGARSLTHWTTREVPSVFNLLRNCQDGFPKQLFHSAFPPGMYEGSNFSTCLPTPVTVYLYDSSHSGRCGVGAHCDFDVYLSQDIEHLFMYLLAMCVSSLDDVYLSLFPFKNFSLMNYNSSLYNLNKSPLSDIQFENIFSCVWAVFSLS